MSVQNILAVYRSATDVEREEGAAWYSTAHTFAVGLSDVYGLSVDAAAGIVAALSPRVSWSLNLRLAETVGRTGTCKGLLGNVRKAERIHAGEAPLDVLGGNKVRSFFDNIVDPEHSQAVTVDRHAWDIADGKVGDDRIRKALDRKGVYDAIADEYREAAAILGVAPHVVQATTWVAWRNRKAEGAIAA